MRTVKVRILPPQPNSPSKNDAIGGVGCFNTDCTTFSSKVDFVVLNSFGG
jgi:hypothetical protein